MKLGKWLRVGMHVKRWLLLLLLGITMLSLALAMGLATFYRHVEVPGPATSAVQGATLQFIPHPYREILVGVPGLALTIFALYYLGTSILSPFLLGRGRPRHLELAEAIERHRFGAPRPRLKVVAIGGGTGLSTLLRGLKQHEELSITAIVSIADDGGSSGRLREELEMPPPGDIRNCIVALADTEPLLSSLFQHRFTGEGSTLKGHSFGNLFLAAMTDMTGTFEDPVAEVSRVLAVRGRVLPTTLEPVTLCADMSDGSFVCGESNITGSPGTVRQLRLQGRATANPAAIEAILDADLVVLGPGSLYTSVLPNLLVDGIADAVRLTSGLVVYACNVATQRGETDRFSAADHVRALYEHVDEELVDAILVNDNFGEAVKIKPEWGVESVALDGLEHLPGHALVVRRDLVGPATPLRHDSAKLAQALVALPTEWPSPPANVRSLSRERLAV
ncbi:MAG: gluconeogenesis factor YvcK family protein [Thermomicrobiales bacterium]